MYTKGSIWLKLFSYSNLLCTRVIRVITNYAPISKYQLKFFLKESFNCLCRLYPIELRCHILHEYKRYNNYWNPNKKFLVYFVIFLEFNLDAFSFYQGICYKLRSLGLDNRTTLVLSNTRELDRELFYKLVYFI